MIKFTSHRNPDAAGYVEHIYVDEGAGLSVIAVIHAAAKQNLFVSLEWHTKNKVDDVEVLDKPPVIGISEYYSVGSRNIEANG